MPQLRMEKAVDRLEPLAPRQEVVEIETHAGAGADRAKEKGRALLTQIDRMHRAGDLDFDRWVTAIRLRDLVCKQFEKSSGVSSYGQSIGASDPYTKGDRQAAQVFRNRTDLHRLADLMFAMVGLHDEQGRKLLDSVMGVLLLRSVLETSGHVTLTEIGAKTSTYGGEKQAPAAGGALLQHLLGRGAAHLGFIKLEEFTDFSAKKLAGNAATMIR